MKGGGMTVLLAQANATRIPLASKSVDLCIGSPPYVDARLYLENGVDLGIARGCQEWIDWMLIVTTEALRVSRGAVIWVATGVTRDRTYWPACEGLMYEWWRRGGSAYRPCYWRRFGIQGSGGDQWFRADVEYVMCFKRADRLPWTNNTAMGHSCKFKPGGAMSYRSRNGSRVWDSNGYIPPEIANPGNLIDTGAAGGGNTGHQMAHENEAPYPEDLAKHFVLSLCPPGGTVLDPFSGSGTTVSVAEQHGRIGIGFDLRRSQAEIARRRIERPHAPVIKQSKAATERHPLFDAAS